MYDLNDLLPAGSGWDIQKATAINNGGQIVGYGYINGQGHAFLMTPDPIPEPSTILLLTTGLAGMGAYSFRSKRKKR